MSRCGVQIAECGVVARRWAGDVRTAAPLKAAASSGTRRARRWICAMLLFVAVALGGFARQPEGAGAPGADGGVRFAAVHVIVDAGEESLGAYQIDVRAVGGDVKVVGVEGATADEGGKRASAFARAPYYDPKAMMGERVVIGDFSLHEGLPSGRVRVATVHVRIAGDRPARFEARVMAAADGEGQRIEATVTTELVTGGGS